MVLGTEPTAMRQCEPSTTLPSARNTATPSPVFDHALGPRTPHDVHAASGKCLGDERGRLGILVGEHAVAGGDQRHLGAKQVVGARKLGSGHAGADHHQVFRQLREVVQLGPREDALAVWLGAGEHARRGPEREQDGVGLEFVVLGCNPSG